MQRWAGWLIGGGLLALALADVAMRYTPMQIRAGQPFIAELYLDVFGRLPLLPAWVVLSALAWGVLKARSGGRVGSTIGWALATAAVALFALISPVVALLNGSNVVHVTSLTVGATRYVLYVEPSLSASCDVVLARCDGLFCRYVTDYTQPICLGRNSPYRLSVDDGLLIVWYGADEVERRLR